MEYSRNNSLYRASSAMWRHCLSRWAAGPLLCTLAMSSIALIILLLGVGQLERPGKRTIPVASYSITPAEKTPFPLTDTSLTVVGNQQSTDRVALHPEPDTRLMPADVFRASKATRIDALIAQANTDIDELRLTTPPGNNAWERLLEVAVLDPQNGAVQTGLQRILARYIQLAKEAETKSKVQLSQLYIDRAELILFGSGISSLSRQMDHHSAHAHLIR